MKIKIKRLDERAVIPRYSSPGDAAMDLTAISREETDKYIEYGTGLAFEIPENHVGLIFPRSSLSKKDLILANSVGVLDSGYRGELRLRFKKTGKEIYEIGDRVGQIMIVPHPRVEFEEAEELSETRRGAGGFGSTGL